MKLIQAIKDHFAYKAINKVLKDLGETPGINFSAVKVCKLYQNYPEQFKAYSKKVIAETLVEITELMTELTILFKKEHREIHVGDVIRLNSGSSTEPRLCVGMSGPCGGIHRVSLLYNGIRYNCSKGQETDEVVFDEYRSAESLTKKLNSVTELEDSYTWILHLNWFILTLREVKESLVYATIL